MSVLALVGLAVLWAIVLLPDFIRRFSASRRSDTIGNFARTLSVLDATPTPRGGRAKAAAGASVGRSNVVPFAAPVSQPVAPLQPRPSAIDSIATPVRRSAPAVAAQRQGAPRSASKTRLQQRRQDVLVVLFAASGLTFLGSISFGSTLLVLHAICDVLLVAYMFAMSAVTRREARPTLTARTYQYPMPSYNGLVPVAPQRRAASR